MSTQTNNISDKSASSLRDDAPETVVGEFNYIVRSDEIMAVSADQPRLTTARWEPHLFPVHDIRLAKTPPSLEREGFMMAKLPLDIGSRADVESIAEIYHPSLERLIARITGAPKIFLQGAMMRWSDRVAYHPDIENSDAVSFAHSDFDLGGFLETSDSFIADDPEAERWRNGRRAIIQTWRSLTPPPQDRPLAVLNRNSIRPEDIVKVRAVLGREGHEEWVWFYNYLYNPDHEWSYISNMTSDDVLIFVGFDTEWDGLAGIPHQAFDLTPSVENCVPRWSYEVRAFVYWG